MESKEELGLGIKAIRKSMRINKSSLAKKANLNRDTISNIENGKNFDIITLYKILNVLGLKVSLIAK